MALGNTPTLQEIKFELSSSSNKLTDFIDEVGQTGNFNKQSDFANYTVKLISNITELYFSYIGGSQAVSIECIPVGWTLYSKPKWITISPSSSTLSPQSLIVTSGENLGPIRFDNLVLKQNNRDIYESIYCQQNGYI